MLEERETHTLHATNSNRCWSQHNFHSTILYFTIFWSVRSLNWRRISFRIKIKWNRLSHAHNERTIVCLDVCTICTNHRMANTLSMAWRCELKYGKIHSFNDEWFTDKSTFRHSAWGEIEFSIIIIMRAVWLSPTSWLCAFLMDRLCRCRVIQSHPFRFKKKNEKKKRFWRLSTWRRRDRQEYCSCSLTQLRLVPSNLKRLADADGKVYYVELGWTFLR